MQQALGVQPLVYGDVGPFKGGSGSDRELPVASLLVALMVQGGPHFGGVAASTMRALFLTVRPKSCLNGVYSGLSVREPFKERKSACRLVTHSFTPCRSGLSALRQHPYTPAVCCVKYIIFHVSEGQRGGRPAVGEKERRE